MELENTFFMSKKKGQLSLKIRYLLKNLFVNKSVWSRKFVCFLQIYVTFIGFNHTNDETYVPRRPCKKETKFLDGIFNNSKHHHSFKTCAKLILILLKIKQKKTLQDLKFV